MKNLLEHLIMLTSFTLLLVITIMLLSYFPVDVKEGPVISHIDYWWKKFSVWSKEDEPDDTEYEVIIEEGSGKKILREKPKEEKEEKPPTKKEEHYRTFQYCDISFINAICFSEISTIRFLEKEEKIV